MMHNDSATSRRIPAILRLLLYAVVWFVWDNVIVNSALSSISGELSLSSSSSALVGLLINLGYTMLSGFMTLFMMHKLVFFSAASPRTTFVPLLISYGAYSLGSSAWVLLLSLAGWRTILPLLSPLSYLGGIGLTLLCMALHALRWRLTYSEYRSAWSADVNTVRLCVKAAAVSFIISAVSSQSSLIYREGSYLLISLAAFLGELLTLWHGVYRDSMDTALPPAKQESSAVFVSRDDTAPPQKKARRTTRTSDGKRRSLFNRYDLENDERVIAQSSLDAIRVMEHHELEMKHEWNCNDDQEEHKK